MDTEMLGRTWLMNLLTKPAGAIMESRLRGWLMPPKRTLRGAHIAAGQSVLEVGCGTGFFTLHAAEMIGERGRLVALEPLAGFAARVSERVRAAGLNNVEVLQRDALRTGLQNDRFDLVLLFGVVPFPTLPLERLLPEMHRVLKTDGTLAVWLFPTAAGVPGAIVRSGLFSKTGKECGVYSFRRSDAPRGDPRCTGPLRVL